MIYVMSDIHGNKRRFKSVLKQIDLQPEDTLYILGDVIDRHTHGIEILQYIMAQPNMKMLIGNHEYMMLNVLDPKPGFFPFEDPRGLWYENWGEGTEKAFEKLSIDEKRELIAYLNALPYNIDIEVKGAPFKLVHAVPIEWFPDLGGYYDEKEYAVWARIDPRKAINDYTLIFGHTTTCYYQSGTPMKVWYGNGIIGIDCGSGWPDHSNKTTDHPQGRLACLRLDDMKEFYSEELSSNE